MFGVIIVAYLLTGGFRIAHIMRITSLIPVYRQLSLPVFGLLYVIALIFWFPIMIRQMLRKKTKS